MFLDEATVVLRMMMEVAVEMRNSTAAITPSTGTM